MDLRELSALVGGRPRLVLGKARALYTVQSNISASIAHLERELGVTLVDRAKGRLTPEGVVVVARTGGSSGSWRPSQPARTSMGQEVTGETRLGVIGTTARWLVPQLLSAVHAAHPVQVIILEASATSLVPQLITGHLDLAVVNLPVDDPEIDSAPLFEEELVLLTTAESPLADRGRVAAPTWPATRSSSRPRARRCARTWTRRTRRTGVTLLPQAEIDGVRLMASLAFEGYGSTIVPTTAVPGWFKGAFAPDPHHGHGPAAGRPGPPPTDDAGQDQAGRGEVLQAVIADKGPRQGRAGLGWGPAGHVGAPSELDPPSADPPGLSPGPSHGPARSRARSPAAGRTAAPQP